MICFTEVRFLQTYSPLRWSQRPGLFKPFPSLKRSLGPSELLFSIKRKQTSPQGPQHNWCLLPWLQLSCSQERMKEGSNPSAGPTLRVCRVCDRSGPPSSVGSHLSILCPNTYTLHIIFIFVHLLHISDFLIITSSR
jgi:hypothetical protein